jgi:hypothetical protein
MPTLDFKERPGDPVLEGWLGGLYNTPLGFAGRQAKSTLKDLNSGKDVSSMGYFNSIAQRHASNRRDIGDNYLYGGNALLANNGGGEQANILNRMKDTALAHDYERQGNETVDAVANLRDSATNTFENARNTRLNAEQAAIQGRSNYWRDRYVPYQKEGFLDKFGKVAGIIGNLAGGAGSFMTGGASAGLFK